MQTIVFLILLTSIDPVPQVSFIHQFNSMKECREFIIKSDGTPEVKKNLGCLQIVRQDKSGNAI